MKRDGLWHLHRGDCLEYLRSLPAASVAAVVCEGET